MLELYGPAMLLSSWLAARFRWWSNQPSQGSGGVGGAQGSRLACMKNGDVVLAGTTFLLTTITKETGPMKLQMK